MQEPVDAKGKKMALEERRRREADLEAQVAKLERAMREEDSTPVGCGGRMLRWMFGRKGASQRSGGTDQTMADQAIFGQQRGATAHTATDRLNKAAESMSMHVQSLDERAQAARQQAKGLMSAGKKAEAMLTLKRAKQTEKQLENAMATHSALERQVDVLAEAALQKEVASALTASVATAKKRTKGLLTKAEDAVDGAVELRDFAEDVASTFGGLQQDQFDDDELLEELQAMTASDDVVLEEEDRSAVTAPEPQSVSTVDLSAFPEAPRRAPGRGRGGALERKSLLSDDSAAVSQGECV